MVFQLSSPEEIRQLEDTFKLIDTDSNGLISKDELHEGYKRIYWGRLSEEEIRLEVDMLWEQADVDGSGEIDYTEWSLATANKEALLTEKRLKQAFSLFDIDNSGFITADELRQVMNPLITGQKTTDDEWKKLIEEVDENGDGQISFDEFKSLMRELILGSTQVLETRRERNELVDVEI